MGLGFPHPSGAVSTRGMTMFVPRLSELYVHGGISDPGMGLFLPGWYCSTNPSQSAISQWGRFHTVRGGYDSGVHHFSSPDRRS